MNRVTEHEIETVEGIPDRLPAGEEVLWQGRPAFLPVTRRAFHLTGVGIYFVVLALWQVMVANADGLSGGQMAASVSWTLTMGAGAMAILLLLGYCVHRTTIYTITSKRVVMKIGMALPMSLNIPFKAIESADCGVARDGSGDLTLTINNEHRIAWAILWPHARPWHFRHPQPALRALRDVSVAAGILRNALQDTEAGLQPLRPTVRTVRTQRTGGEFAAASH